MFDDTDDDATVFELTPLGARQRVIPGHRFKPVASVISELDPSQIVDEQVIATQRVSKLPPPIPLIRRMSVTLTAQLPPPPPPIVLPPAPASRLAGMLSRFALPIGGALVVLLLSLYLALPGHARDLSTRIAPLAIGSEAPTESFQLTTSDDQPPEQLEQEVIAPPERHHRASKPRKIIAVDSSTPLGNLRPRK